MFCYFTSVTRHSFQAMCIVFSRKDLFRLFAGLLRISTRKTNAEPRCLTSLGGSLLVARVKFESRVNFESRVRFQFFLFFFSFFFFDYTNDVRAVTRNINFPIGDIFHSRSKEPLPLRIGVASPRYTTTFNIIF